MKTKHFGIIMAMVAGLIFSASAMAVTPYDANAIKSVGAIGGGAGPDNMLTSVTDDGADVIITLTNIRFTPIGKNTDGKDLTTADTVALYSGIMDAKGSKEPFVIAKVVNGKATFRIPNSAKIVGKRVAESIWGRSANGQLALVHDPLDPWVIAYNNDFQRLAIWIEMYPNAPTVPARKTFGDKPVQGEVTVK